MTISERLFAANEPYAAGLFEYPEREPLFRYANAQKRYWEAFEFAPYDGGRLYPCGRVRGGRLPYAVNPHYSNTIQVDFDRLREVGVDEECIAAIREEYERVTGFPTPHIIGAGGWTHSFLNYERILKDGICGYRTRVEALGESDFRDGLLVLLDGIDLYKNRLLEHLRGQENVKEGLIEALERVDQPPRNIYEALVVWNFAFYLDRCDDIGHLDRFLLPYWHGEDIVDLLRELFRHADGNEGWSGALGPDYNELTLQCIRASHYTARPSLQLLVKKDMPDEVWNEIYESLGSSCGQPALYNYEEYRKGLAREFPQIPEADRERIAFGGCTETMLEGISNVGSDDLGIHVALMYDEFTRAHLAEFDTFEAYYDALVAYIHRETAKALDLLDSYRRTRGQYRPSPIRTLFVDDCIDKGLDFNAGGARYYWSVNNVSGLINVIDSVSVVKKLVFETKEYDAASFHEALDRQDPVFLRKARACPCFGVDDEELDALAADLAGKVYDGFNQRECWPSGKYITVSNQFVVFESAGRMVGATPDGRAACSPLCDSMGAVHGKDVKGPTALLNSVSALPLNRALGTPILNFRMKKEHLSTLLKPLVLGFFQRGGMQMQISCLSREDMLDALEHPEKHENLMVRIGGYSEYFNRLSPTLKQTVLARTEY